MRGLALGFVAASSAYRRNTDLDYIRTGIVAGHFLKFSDLFIADITVDELEAPAFLTENTPSASGGIDTDMNQWDSHLVDELEGTLY